MFQDVVSLIAAQMPTQIVLLGSITNIYLVGGGRLHLATLLPRFRIREPIEKCLVLSKSEPQIQTTHTYKPLSLSKNLPFSFHVEAAKLV